MPHATPMYNGPKRLPGRKPDQRYLLGKRLYNDVKWRNASKRFIREHPYCAACNAYLLDAKGEPISNACVDHKEPHKGDTRLFWDVRNWQSLCCSPCHNSKTARVDRGRK